MQLPPSDSPAFALSPFFTFFADLSVYRTFPQRLIRYPVFRTHLTCALVALPLNDDGRSLFLSLILLPPSPLPSSSVSLFIRAFVSSISSLSAPPAPPPRFSLFIFLSAPPLALSAPHSPLPALSAGADDGVVRGRDGKDSVLTHGTEQLHGLLPLVAPLARAYDSRIDHGVWRQPRLAHLLFIFNWFVCLFVCFIG